MFHGTVEDLRQYSEEWNRESGKLRHPPRELLDIFINENCLGFTRLSQTSFIFFMTHKTLSFTRFKPRGFGKSLTAVLILHIFAASGFPQDQQARQIQQDPQSSPLKIMTYNIWNGFDWGKDSVRMEKCITWIKSQEPDVLALQELCGYTENKLKENAKRWGHPYVQLLKTEGYPTALTSKKPIRLKEKTVGPFWHGLLHCETYGIDFYVVHLSPSDCNIRLKEARLITDRIEKNQHDSFIILGDFNSLSPFDGILLEANTDLRKRSRPENDNNYSNLRMGEFDYSVMSEFLACPAVDLCLGKMDLDHAYTFPTPALIGKYEQTAETIIQYRVRIDYILASPSLALSCRKVAVFNQEDTHLLSDHFPVMAEFLIIKE